jgi:hypothetical protein
MGNTCTSDTPPHSDQQQAGHNTQQATLANKSYLETLFGPANAPNASPYHPLSRQPVLVPKLFDLALEQLCVSLVDQQSLEALLIQQQRKRRGSIRIAESDGGGTLPSTPTASAAAVWTSTPPVEKGFHGATRRYSHADAYPPPNYLVKTSKSAEKERLKQQQQQHQSPSGGLTSAVPLAAPRSPFHAHNVMVHSPVLAGMNGHMAVHIGGAGFSTPKTPKRARSLSLSSKESPELQPQLYQAGALGSSQRMLLASGTSATGSAARRDSHSSAGSSPLYGALGGPGNKSVPASPFWLGASANASTSSPHTHSFPHGAAASPASTVPPLHRSHSTPSHDRSGLAGGEPQSQPAPPTRSWLDPPELALPPSSSSKINLSAAAMAGGRARFKEARLLDENGDELQDGFDLSTSTLLSSGSIGTAALGSSSSVSRQLRLPDTIIQLIFDRLISEELLTQTNIHLFTASNLSRMDFTGNAGRPSVNEDSTNVNCANIQSKYSQELTDEWMHVLFENIVRHYHTLQTMLQQSHDTRMQPTPAGAGRSMSTPATPMISAARPTAKTISPPAIFPFTGSSTSPPVVRSSQSASSSSSSVSSSPLPASSPLFASSSCSTSPSPSTPPKRAYPVCVIPPHRVNLNGEEARSLQTGGEEQPEARAAVVTATLPGILANMRQSNAIPGGQEVPASAAVSSPRLVPSTNSPQHGSITSLQLERQLSANKMALDSTPSPKRLSNADLQASTSSSLLQSFSNLSPVPHRVDPLPVVHTPASFASPMPTIHNPLSITSPAPSLALYRHAPTLTSLNLSGCYQITNRSLQPLQVCLMLTDLNLNQCTQISDELLMCTLGNKFYLQSLQLKGLKGVTDKTLEVLADKGKLKRLYLDSCNITDHGLSALGGLTHLQHFSVGWCGKRVTERGLAFLKQNFRLKTLCLAFTGIQSLQFFANLRMLKEINLSGCRIAEPSLKQLNSFPHLTHVYLPRTAFREIPSAFLHHGLVTLDLSFSSAVASGKLLHQFQHWCSSAPIDLKSTTSTSFATTGAQPPLEDAEVEVGWMGDGEGEEGMGSSGSRSHSYLSTSLLEQELSASPPAASTILASASSSSYSTPPRAGTAAVAHRSIQSVGVGPVVPTPPILLRTLILESCCIDNRIAQVIGENCVNLTDLNIVDTDVTSDGLLAFAPLKMLRSLNFSGCKVLNHSLAVLSHFKQLSELYMDCPSITDAGLAHLRCLAPTLLRLDVFETPVSESGLEHILLLRRLTFLELCGGRLTNMGLARIATNLPALTSLNVSQNKKIDDLGLDALRSLRQLVHLNLSGCSVTHKGFSFLHAVKKQNESGSAQPAGHEEESPLKRISLFGCEFKATSSKMKDLPSQLQLGIDAGVVSIE